MLIFELKLIINEIDKIFSSNFYIICLKSHNGTVMSIMIDEQTRYMI